MIPLIYEKLSALCEYLIVNKKRLARLFCFPYDTVENTYWIPFRITIFRRFDPNSLNGEPIGIEEVQCLCTVTFRTLQLFLIFTSLTILFKLLHDIDKFFGQLIDDVLVSNRS